MSATAEPQTAPKEPETKRHDSISSSPIPEQASEGDGGLFSHVFSGAPGQPPMDSATRFIGNPTLSHSVNNCLRTIYRKRAQQAYGNHFVQRALSGVQSKPATPRFIQCQCACGGMCEQCTNSSVEPLAFGQSSSPPSLRLIQTQIVGLMPTGGGKPLDESTHALMKSRFYNDFSSVY